MKISLHITPEIAENIAVSLLTDPPSAAAARETLTLICNQAAIATERKCPKCEKVLFADYAKFQSRRAGHLPKARRANHPQ